MELVTQYNNEEAFIQLDKGHMFLTPDTADGLCTYTKLPLGEDTGFKDKFGNTIYTNSLLKDLDDSIAEVTWIEYTYSVEYYISNYHCSACPIISSSLQVVGILDENEEYHFYVGELDKEC
jgi:alkyl hydroperoxide reductase subunit AhpF